jgi:predicted GIY-YIG superfamily endonuclease
MLNNKEIEISKISKSTIKHRWLYILKLNEGKYYVGQSTNPWRRIKQHENGFYSSQLAKKYGYLDHLPFIDIGEVTSSEASHLEDIKTLETMKQYGYQNVRGGKFNYSGKYVKIGPWFARGIDFAELLGVLFFVLVVAILYFDTNR